MGESGNKGKQTLARREGGCEVVDNCCRLVLVRTRTRIQSPALALALTAALVITITPLPFAVAIALALGLAGILIVSCLANWRRRGPGW